jgi:hypothetical protein
MDFRVGYEKLDREAIYKSTETAIEPNRMYAYAGQNRDSFKTSVDFFPLENLNFGFEYRHRRAEYTDTIFGLKKDKRDVGKASKKTGK